jgi:hypothetical protein
MSYSDIKKFELYKHVEFANGYEKYIKVESFIPGYYRCGGYAAAAESREPKFIEIDIDKTKLRNSSHVFEEDV